MGKSPRSLTTSTSKALMCTLILRNGGNEKKRDSPSSTGSWRTATWTDYDYKNSNHNYNVRVKTKKSVRNCCYEEKIRRKINPAAPPLKSVSAFSETTTTKNKKLKKKKKTS